MEYIYRFIEFINESNLFSIGTLLFTIVYLMRLYTKKENEENYLPLKIIGFYFLGGFNFNFKINWFVVAIPIGFLIYYLAMKEKERPNPKIKYKATVLGVIMMLVGTLNGMIYEKAEYRERTIKVEDVRFENLEKEYDFIRNKLEIDYASIEAMQLEYDNNGKIKDLNYTLRDDKKIYYIIYENDAYKVNVLPVNKDGFWNFGPYGSYYDSKLFFNMISNVKFDKYDNAKYYRMTFRGEKNYYENMGFYTINQENYSIKNLGDIRGVYDAIGIVNYAILDTPIESHKGNMYLLDYGNIEYELDYEEIEIESIKNNEIVVIRDKDIIKEIYKATMDDSESWSLVTDMEITLEPNLYVKYSEDIVVGLCEEEPFIRVDEGKVSSWYVVPSHIYTFVVNRYFDASRAEAMYNN